MLYKATRTRLGFKTVFTGNFNMPGYLLPNHTDHGYGALATIVESILEPDTWIRFHPHSNDEIISYVPFGVMRHTDNTAGELLIDQDHLLVMNAGREFWHEERTLPTDPPLRMLQIFVRPHTLDLEPFIQHGPVQALQPGGWRHLFGPEGSPAPFFVRNDVHGYDIDLAADQRTALPQVPGWDAYFYVYSGSLRAGNEHFAEAETGLAVGETELIVSTLSPTRLVVFLINPQATVTRRGTIGR